MTAPKRCRSCGVKKPPKFFPRDRYGGRKATCLKRHREHVSEGVRAANERRAREFFGLPEPLNVKEKVHLCALGRRCVRADGYWKLPPAEVEVQGEVCPDCRKRAGL
jgi:NMD protein affecting ribosome stability and mRNA decay